MSSVALWLLGTSAAFLATAGAFLLLTNHNSNPATNDPIPRAETSGPQDPAAPALVLELSKDRLEELRRQPGQKLTLLVENEGDQELSNVELALGVVSENTAHPQARYYQETLEQLAPKESATVEFEIDLSPPESGEPDPDPQAREILEARATTPGGASAFKTAVLSP